LDLPKIQDEKIKFESDSQVQTTLSEPSQIPPIEIESEDQSDIIADLNRERTLSNASSATVDYDFDTETCTALI